MGSTMAGIMAVITGSTMESIMGGMGRNDFCHLYLWR